MIKPEEAIEAIKSNYPDSRYTVLREALNLAMEALEKAAPLKMNMLSATSETSIEIRLYVCPKCGEAVELLDKYCSECGQKLMEWI